MSPLLFAALTLLGGGSYSEKASDVEAFNSFVFAHQMEVVGEKYGVRLSCTPGNSYCFAAHKESGEIIFMVKD